ncbi:MAG: rod shape-determining protein RodA [Anaerolineae bacterium]|jgi:rod shape determining protein RodA|nr:rod shape-determining protein RodA [Anaerolineae bacterium]
MKREIWRNFDFWLFGAALFLSIFGIMMIQSAIAGNATLAQAVSRQPLYLIGGTVLMLIMAAIDYHYWGSLSRFIYIFAIISLLIIYVVGTVSFGSARWLDTGVIMIQPSEIVKILMIMVLADFFAKNIDKPHDLKWIFQSFLMTFGVVIWILLQPNLSTSIVIFVIWFALVWICGVPVKYLLILALVGIVLIAAAFPLLEDYQRGRIINFLFPDPEASYGDTYNVEQALITIGSGGLLGEGYGQGTQVQLRFLKVRHTDFIFSALAEEFGFVGAMTVMGLLLFLIWRCMEIGRTASDLYGSLIAYSYAAMLFFQTAVNIGVNLNVVPVSGLPLPFISYGGSSLLSSILGIGLVESVALRKGTITS